MQDIRIEQVRTLYGTDAMKQAVIAYGEMVAAGLTEGGSWPFDLKAEAVCARDCEGEIVGLIVWRVYDDAPDEAWLQLSWVGYFWRRKGIYRSMIEALQEDLKTRGIRKLETAVRDDNQAMREAKERLGFTVSRTIYALEMQPAQSSPNA